MAIDVAEARGSLPPVEAVPAADQKGRWFGRRRMRLVAIAAVLVIAVGAALVYRRSTGRAMHDAESGPVRTESDTTTAIVAEVGEVVTFGGIILENFSERPAVLESIRIDPPLDEAMGLVDVKVAGKDRGIGMVGADRGFPPAGTPPESLRPLPGAVVPPRHEDDEWGIEVFMGFKLNRPGRFGFHQALVDYRIGNKRHRIRVDDGFFICGPRSDFPRGCELNTLAESED